MRIIILIVFSVIITACKPSDEPGGMSPFFKPYEIHGQKTPCNTAGADLPPGWKIETEVGGELVPPKEIELFLVDVQRYNKDRSYTGYEIRKELADKPVLSVKNLVFLLNHQEQIPEKWKLNSTVVRFWGTIYRHPDGQLQVPSVSWTLHDWDFGCAELSHRADLPNLFAAIRRH